MHYCWFGPDMPKSVKNNVEQWKAQNPDFEIKLHTESNINISSVDFAKAALDNQAWAFLSDIVRLQALYEEGGVYLDVDVELIKPLSSLVETSDKLTMGYMYDCALGTAVIYAPPHHPFIKDILKRYEKIKPGEFPVNNSIFTEYFINSVPGFLLNGKEWGNEYCHIYPKEFFEQPAFIRNRGISIHHCYGSWNPHATSLLKNVVSYSMLSHLKKWLARKWRTYRACQSNEFNPVYRAALQGKSIPFHARWYSNKSLDRTLNGN